MTGKHDVNTTGEEQPPKEGSRYQRLERRLLTYLPAFFTPLRFRILLGYIVVFILAIFGWEQLASAWRYLVTLLAPVTALIGALLALKLSVVVLSVFTLLTSIIKLFFGFLVVVLKPGILKAIFIPQVVSLLVWIHRKSYRLQVWFGKFYNRAKGTAESIVEWWGKQGLLDKILLSGFLVPLLVVLLVVFIIERATAIFAVKKLTEQVVQRATKYTIKNFYRLPLVGWIPATVADRTRKITRKDDREDLITDLKNLGEEIYEPEENTVPSPGAGAKK